MKIIISIHRYDGISGQNLLTHQVKDRNNYNVFIQFDNQIS